MRGLDAPTTEVICPHCGGTIYKAYITTYKCVRCNKRFDALQYHNLWLINFKKENHAEISKLAERSLF